MTCYRAITAFVLMALLGFIGACDGLSDLNEDPNNPIEVQENLQLPGLLSNFSYEIVANTAVRIPAHWVQHLAWSGNAPSVDNYDIDESDVNNLWEFWAYTDVLSNARLLASQAEANENPAYAGIAKIIEAWTLSILTDLWGEIPYSEAFNPDESTPAYDSQEAVYQAVFDLLDAAIADLEEGGGLTPGPASDLLYGGDLSKWVRLAYTLKARFAMRLSMAPGYNEVEQAQQALDALANGFQSNDDDADFAYFATSGAENPWYQWTIDGKWDTRDQLSTFYVDLLKSKNDPRLPIQARPVGAVGNNGLVAGFQSPPFVEEDFSLEDPTYVGQPSGQEGLGAPNVSSIGAYYSAANAPLTWISYASSQFLKAEATLITQGAAAAQPIFEAAIEANMDKLGVDPAVAASYIASRPALAEVDARDQIITEKYVANFLNLEAYNDWRRTGYPELQPVTNQAMVERIPLRFPYPSSELARNAANVSATGIPRGFQSMTVPVWWDTTL